MQPELQVINTEKEFKWRLKLGEEVTVWDRSYESICRHTFSNGETWFVAMAYWDGTLPIEEPFQIVGV